MAPGSKLSKADRRDRLISEGLVEFQPLCIVLSDASSPGLVH